MTVRPNLKFKFSALVLVGAVGLLAFCAGAAGSAPLDRSGLARFLPDAVSGAIADPTAVATLSEQQLAANQNLLAESSARVHGKADDSLSGLAVNAATLEITTWWYGEIPAWVSELSLPEGVKVVSLLAKYRRADLSSAARAILTSVIKSHSGIPISASVYEDGSGIELTTDTAGLFAVREAVSTYEGPVSASDITVSVGPVSEGYPLVSGEVRPDPSAHG